jgi:hypothetical protein
VSERTNVKGIVLPHFAHELPADPITNLRPAFLIEPPKILHRFDDPLALALLREHVPKPNVVGSPPERKVEEEKEPARGGLQGVEEHKLKRKEAEVKNVDVRFGVRRVKKRCDDIVCRRDAEN